MSIESKLKIEQFKMRLRTIQHSCSGKRQSRLQLSCLGKRFYEPSAKLNIQHCACARLNIEQFNIGKADNSTLKTQNSTMPKALPPAWFRSTGPSLFNHTCLTFILTLSPSDNHSLRTYGHTLAEALKHQPYCLSPIR